MAWSAAHDSLPGLNREITIVGGGLAGLSLAGALCSRGVPVTVLEAGNYPRHRVCGEFISGVSAETLQTLGIAHLLADSIRHFSLRWHDRDRLIYQAFLTTPALGISRHLLDDRLRQHAERLGCVIRTGTRTRPEAIEGRVWAAGRRACSSPWIGLKVHLRHPPRPVDLEMHVGDNGYAGVSNVEDGWTNVCGLFRVDRSIHGNGPDLLAAYLRAGGNHRLASAVESCDQREGSFCAVAGFELGRQTSGTSAQLSLGDADRMIPPFTGNGMSMAFQAAECALDPLTSWAKNERSWPETATSVRSALTRKFRRRMTAAATMHPFLLARGGRFFIRSLAQAHLLPFHPMLALVR